MSEVVAVERDLVKWWDPSTFRGRAVATREDVAAGAMSMTGTALSVLHEIMSDRSSKPHEKLQAVSMVLDRAVGKAAQEVKVTATYVPPELEGDELLEILAAAHERLQERNAVVIDVDED